VPDLGHGDAAAIDGKVASARALRAADRAAGVLPFSAISGPTTSASCPPFTWATASIKADHAGLPDAYNFPWVEFGG
jgi:hypothetical protein